MYFYSYFLIYESGNYSQESKDGVLVKARRKIFVAQGIRLNKILL